jgi:predicted nucleic acid-binding protein
MIHLDTNYLIGLLVKGFLQAQHIHTSLAKGEVFAASAVSWTEFLSGPVAPLDVGRAMIVLQSRIIPFGQREAVLAAELFNKTGRKRGARLDCLIAATAIVARAEIATVNESDFRVFLPYGLKLASAPAPQPPQSN